MIKRFEVEVVRTDKYIIEIDEDVIDEKWMEEFRGFFYDFHTLEEHAKHIAQYRARFGNFNAGFIEGYGTPLLNGKKSWSKKNEKAHQPAINIQVVSEDNDIEVDIVHMSERQQKM